MVGKEPEEGENKGLISENRVIIESLYLVKSHKITAACAERLLHAVQQPDVEPACRTRMRLTGNNPVVTRLC